MYGRYPGEELWRINLSYILVVVTALPLFFKAVPGKVKGVLAGILLLVYPIVFFYLYVGGSFGLEFVETPRWGGLFLTLVIAVTGIVASLPLGIVLALGRRSEMPVVKSICVVFIEFWRGIPSHYRAVHGVSHVPFVCAGKPEPRQAGARTGGCSLV